MTHETADIEPLRVAATRFGIRQKILAVLVGVLLLTTAVEAILASYYTNRQNEQAAFDSLSNQLFAWAGALQATTRQLAEVAIATMGDAAVLNQLAELLTLEFNVNDPARVLDKSEMARALAYRKTVSLNRLQLALRTGGFSSIAVYTRGKLSHYVSTSAAGMMVTRANGSQVWVTATADAKGSLPFQSWPAWSEQPLPPLEGAPAPVPRQPSVSFVFPEAQQTMIEIAVPVQGLVDDSMTDAERNPVVRFFSELTVAGMPQSSSSGTLVGGSPGKAPQIVAAVVFRKLIGRSGLETLARETGNAPTLWSPDGTHRQQLTGLELIPPDLLAQAQAQDKGCDQVVWLDAVEHKYIEEMGGMNLFFVYQENGKTIVVTPQLTGTLLPGITRLSLLQLAKDLGYEAEERKLSTQEWRDDIASGKMTEVFACGTAAVITPVGHAKANGYEIRINNGENGPVTMALREALLAIQHGTAPDKHNWLHPIC